MAQLDPLMRYGNPNQNGEQLINVLRAIPGAAKAASFNLQTFVGQLQSTASAIAQSTGMKQGQITSALTAFSAVTGLAPERAQQLFSSQNLTLAAAMTGKTMTQLYEHPSAAPEMAYGQMIFKSMTGMSAEQLNALRKTDVAKYNHLMDGVYRLYNNNKEIFGGYSPLELINMQMRNNGQTRRNLAVTQAIQDTSGSGAVDKIQGLLNVYGGGAGKQFQQWRDNYLSDPNHPLNNKSDYQKFREAAQTYALDNILGSRQKAAGHKTAAEITLSPLAKKYFDLLSKNTGQADTPGRNTASLFSRDAKGIAKTPAGLDMPLLVR
jgi:hypothetical protein